MPYFNMDDLDDGVRQKLKEQLEAARKAGLYDALDPKNEEVIYLEGIEETLVQYQGHFLQEQPQADSPYGLGKFKPGTSFQDVMDYRDLDLEFRRKAMTSMNRFEQNFRAAMVRIIRDQIGSDYETYTDPRFMKEEYQLPDGRLIRRGQLKSRLRRIRSQADAQPELKRAGSLWLTIKLLSFGLVEDWFFLLPDQYRTAVQNQVFGDTMDNISFEECVKKLTLLRAFRQRAAHNFNLIDWDYQGAPAYPQLVGALNSLVNPDVVGALQVLAIHDPVSLAQYEEKHPEDMDYIRSRIY